MGDDMMNDMRNEMIYINTNMDKNHQSIRSSVNKLANILQGIKYATDKAKQVKDAKNQADSIVKIITTATNRRLVGRRKTCLMMMRNNLHRQLEKRNLTEDELIKLIMELQPSYGSSNLIRFLTPPSRTLASSVAQTVAPTVAPTVALSVASSTPQLPTSGSKSSSGGNRKSRRISRKLRNITKRRYSSDRKNEWIVGKWLW